MSEARDSQPKQLSSESQARWDALKDAVWELVGAAGDPDGFPAAFAALRQIGRGLDMKEILNALHVPEDAGEHAGALRRMLLRIPDGWGRWIGCSRGWYPILVELDEQLAALFPGYELHQVKEKYGGLRFYWAEGERATDPGDPEPALPVLDDHAQPAENDAVWAAWESAHDDWQQRLDRYLQTDEGAARRAAFDRRLQLAEQLIDAAERRADATCELCGQPGQSCCTRGPHPWYQTLCDDCARERGYIPSSQRDPRT